MAFIKQSKPDAGATEQRSLPRDLAGLGMQLASDDSMERRWAARDLVAYPESAAMLVAQLKREDELSVREVIMTTLTRIGNDVAVAGMADCLRSEEAHIRNEAIEAMKQLPHAVAPVMSALLTDDDADVRIMAVNVLESLRHADVEAWLIEIILRDPAVNVCGAAVDLLSEVGSGSARDALLRLKARFAAEPYIQFAANLALSRIDKV